MRKVNPKTMNALRLPAMLLSIAALVTLAAVTPSSGASSPTPIAIYQYPLTVAIPAHPQVILALGNSESMDGNLSGAIMTGSGSLAASLSELQSTSSPVNYTVPTGFTPPVSGGAVGSLAVYTSTVGSNLVDNSPSRLNVAKAGILSVISNFMANTDFALMDYSASGLTLATTWVYYMSQPGSNFTFTSTASANTIPNPCYNVSIVGGSLDTIQTACKAFSSSYTGLTTSPYMVVGATSDNPAINDVLYASGVSAMCVTYGGPTASSNNLAGYEAGNVRETYASSLGSLTCAQQTGPTNAGYVPASQQVMYVQRGFGYYTSAPSGNAGTTVVGMTSSGAAPTAATVTAKIGIFAPFLAPETNNTSTTEIKASAVQSPMAGLLTAAYNYYKNTNPASSNGCAATRYVVLVTDGLPTMDLAGNNWPPLGSTAAAGYGVTATFNADGSLGTTNDQALKDAVTVLTTLKAAGIKTYVIALGAGVAPSTNPTAAQTLTALAVAGGTGAYFPATDPTTVANDLQSILATIQAGTESTATAAVNSTSIHAGSLVYQGQFTTSDTSQDWTGNLYAFPVSATTGQVNTNPSAAIWSAQTQLDLKTWNNRLIATWDPVALKGIPFEWTSGSPASGIASSTTLGTELTTNAADPSGSDALQFLRGNQSFAVANGGQYRNRSHILGDIVDSAPIYVGAPDGVYTGSSYRTYVQNNASRKAVIYVGGNDGMLHAFDAATGNELFAYIPAGVYANMVQLTNRYYDQNHLFFVDGSPVAGEVQFGDASWHTLLVGGENAGGKSIYALDISNASAITTEAQLSSAVLWDFTDGNMGYTYSRPAIANTNAGFMVFFGNGYDSPTQTPFFYAINPQTGAVVAKIDLCSKVPTACSSTLTNGLSSVTLTNSSGDLTQPATIAYAGDLQGNLWRIDVSNQTPSSWTVTVLLQARDPSGVAQPITTTPAASLNVSYPKIQGEMVFVGTGQMLSIADLASTQVQTMYGVYDNNLASTTPLVRAKLVQQTMTNATVTAVDGTSLAARTLTGYPVNILSNPGWYVDFSLQAGERVVTDPELNSGAVLVTSNQPAANTCVGGNNSWLNLFNFATGGSFKTAQLSISTSVISGVSLGASFASSPRVEIYANGAISRAILITESGAGNGSNPNNAVPIQEFSMYGRTLHRTAWWELK
jgi:type IV pilus assembly protein PilY1